tara:strand:+ start:47307 stop:48986 length:1680 start_codon:yes stop_codon:yes gene_type:complete
MNSYLNALIALSMLAGSSLASPITYQGVLEDGGESADGMYDMVFTLADQPVGGFALQDIAVDDVQVSGGLFEIEVDFDDVHFTGADRWLAVRIEGVLLTPRTKINYTPYAIRATSAQEADLAFDLQVPWVVVDTQEIIDATSTRSTAISGRATSLTGSHAGVYGQSDSESVDAVGIHGVISDTEPGFFSAGVYGENRGEGTAGFGVYGTHAGEGYGVYGRSEGDGYGVFGTAPSGFGLYGTSQTGTGIYGFTNTGAEALHARTANGDRAVFADNTNSGTEAYLATEMYGLEAYNIDTPGTGTGLYAEGGQIGIEAVADAIGDGGGMLTRIGVNARAGGPTVIGNEFYGVYTRAEAPVIEGANTAYGIYTSAQTGDMFNTAYGMYSDVSGPAGVKFAGYFQGDVHIAGTLSKSSGSFKIDHPLEPENKYLSHSFVESPDMTNIYHGVETLDASGGAVVALPGYFEALNRDFRYQLTAIGAPMPNLYIASEISSNQFVIAGGVPNAKVSWEVMGVRQDPSAIENPIIVEEEKPDRHKGKYLDPAAFGLDDSHAIHPGPQEN